MQWRNLSYPARALFALLHFCGVEPDGTVAVLKSLDEPVHTAIIRWVGVPRHWRRGIAEPTSELLRGGYIYIDALRVKLANHVQRQAWRSGKIPAAFIESYDHVTGEVHHPKRPERDVNATSTRHQHDVNGTSTRHQHEANGAESQGAAMRDRASPPLSSSASKGQEVTYRQEVAKGDDPQGAGAHHDPPSNGGANVVDIDTGAVVSAFGDPTPDEAIEAASMFDVPEDGPPF